MASAEEENSSQPEASSSETLPEVSHSKETVEEILSRHRKEIKELQSKEISWKKAAAKGSKAEQKAKKKAIDERVSKLDKEMKERQARELSELGYGSQQTDLNGSKSSIDAIVMAMAGMKTGLYPEQLGRVTNAQKRKNKQMQKDKEREQRIQEEKGSTVSLREVETRQLESKLLPIGFSINEVKADGHCLYRAVEEQLKITDTPSSLNYLEIRKVVADYMRAHPDEFIPFMAAELEGLAEQGLEKDLSVDQLLEKHCEEIESSAIWGGQIELKALAHALKRRIIIVSASQPDIEMGEEYAGDGKAPIRVSYHMHAYGLGEHYNSVVSTRLGTME